jgi:vesicle-associated membrane protein 7
MASSSVPATPLLYACIAYKNTILSEHTVSAASGTSSLASVILPKISHDAPQKLTYTHNQNLIHYIADAGSASGKSDSLNAPNLTYLVVAKADLGRRVPFGFLVEIKKRFLASYNPDHTDFSALPAYGAAAYNAQLKSLMVEYGTTKSGQEDAFKNVQGEIDNVRGIMTENIERVLERGERLDLLVDKTDRLGGSARDFRVRSRGLKRRMWWKNMKLMVMLVVVVIFLLYLMVGMGCGLPGKFLLVVSNIESYTDIENSMVSLHPSRLKLQLFPSVITLRRSSVLIPTSHLHFLSSRASCKHDTCI